MKISAPICPYSFYHSSSLKKNEHAYSLKKLSDKNFSLYNTCISNINKSMITFKGYQGDPCPAKKLFWILTGRNDIYEDNYTKSHLANGGNTGWKKWMSDYPQDLLKRTTEQAIQSICTLTKPKHAYPSLYPDMMHTPNYGDNWGRKANYIEINPRAIAKQSHGQVSEGLLSLIKLLPAIPPSPNSFANCIILSQLYPTYGNYDDGHQEQNGLYCVDLHSGISRNLTSNDLTRDNQRMGDDELVRAFNDLAHLKGLKTGIRMPLSEGQMTVKGEPFNWEKHEQAYIDACCYAVNLGFDAIYFDSAKHVGNYDMGNYYGQGNLPDYNKMQWITYQIRQKTNRNDIAFIGEKCNDDLRFRDLGFNAGTDWSKADDRQSVAWESKKQSSQSSYAAGPEVSNDNNCGYISFEQKLNRLNNCLFAHQGNGEKLPTFMQIDDIFPLSPYTNTHELMKHNKFMGIGDEISYWNDIFNTSDQARNYQNAVHQKFLDAMYL